MASKQERQQDALLAANPDLSARDMRDLLMEYGADGPTASELVSDRLDREHRG